jgi:hypothetical protein
MTLVREEDRKSMKSRSIQPIAFTALILTVLHAGGAARAQAPVALVEAIENAPKASVGFLDYVYPGQVIDLGTAGVLGLSYFDSCILETTRGGVVTVQAGASQVAGGSVSTRDVPCQGEKIYQITATSKAGATVTRLGESGKTGPAEWTVSSTRPSFVWPVADKSVSSELTIIDTDQSPAKVVWQGSANGGKLTYPESAPELEVGLPYKVTARGAGGEATAVFTVVSDVSARGTD